MPMGQASIFDKEKVMLDAPIGPVIICSRTLCTCQEFERGDFTDGRVIRAIPTYECKSNLFDKHRVMISS